MFKSSTVLFICFLVSSTSSAHILTKDCQPLANQGVESRLKEQPGTGRIPYPQIDARRVVRIFLEAVENGELIVFDMSIDKSYIKPERVEYIYTLTDRTPTVQVYSTITKPISLPTMPDVQIMGVSAILNSEGEIIETIAHCGV